MCKNSNDVINSRFQIETKPDKLAHACSFTEVLFKLFTAARVHNLLLDDGSNKLPIVIEKLNQSVELSFEEQICISYKCRQISRENSENPGKYWGEDLSRLPIFTLRDAEDHRKKGAKLKGNPTRKILLKRKKFKNEGYILSESLFTLSARERFKAKCMCRASMKKD